MSEDFIKGQVTENGEPIEGAVVVAVKQINSEDLSQNDVDESSALLKLTDENGWYEFNEDELPAGEHNYQIVSHAGGIDDPRRSQENFPFVSVAVGFEDIETVNPLTVENEEDGATTVHYWRIADILGEWPDSDGGAGPEVDEIEITWETADFNSIDENNVAVEMVRETSTGIDRSDIGLNLGTQPYTGNNAVLDLSGLNNTTVAGPIDIIMEGVTNPETVETAEVEIRGDGETFTTKGYFPRGNLISPDASSIYLLDVGQGDATVIRTSENETIVVDTGNNYDDFGWRMEAIGIDKIDVLVTTHAHGDHIGGSESLIERFESKEYLNGVGAVFDPGIDHGTQTYENYLDKIDEYNIPLVIGEEGDELPVDGIQAQLIGPEEDFTGNELHDHCISIRFEDDDGRTFIVTGDANRGEENRIINEWSDGDFLDVDILHLGHHGAGNLDDTSEKNTANDPLWLDTTDPVFVFASAPTDSPFGHPHDTTLTNLADRDITTYWSGPHGEVISRQKPVSDVDVENEDVTTDAAELRDDIKP